MAECKDCIHFCVCSTYTAPNESYPEVCGCPAFQCLADFERKSQDAKDTNVLTHGDRIRAMSNTELKCFLYSIAYERKTPWAEPFEKQFCENCSSVKATLDGKEIELYECDFLGGECPHGDDIGWWLDQPAEVHK